MPKETEPDVDREVGKRVRTLRLKNAMTQPELATMLGVTFQQIQKYENGKNRIPSPRLGKIAEAFGVSVNVFFPGQNGGAEAGAFDFIQDRPEAMLLESYRNIRSPAVRSTLVTLLGQLAAATPGNGKQNTKRKRNHRVSP